MSTEVSSHGPEGRLSPLFESIKTEFEQVEDFVE